MTHCWWSACFAIHYPNCGRGENTIWSCLQVSAATFPGTKIINLDDVNKAGSCCTHTYKTKIWTQYFQSNFS